jgi:Asparagine synthase
MSWGLEARVPFLDKAFLDIAMNIDAKHKMFSKGTVTETDADGRPRMEKVISQMSAPDTHLIAYAIYRSISFVKRLMSSRTAVRCARSSTAG